MNDADRTALLDYFMHDLEWVIRGEPITPREQKILDRARKAAARLIDAARTAQP